MQEEARGKETYKIKKAKKQNLGEGYASTNNGDKQVGDKEEK